MSTTNPKQTPHPSACTLCHWTEIGFACNLGCEDSQRWRWWPCKKGDYANDYAQIAAGHRHVARVSLSSVTEVDLRLMVAAPELLKALSGTLDALECWTGTDVRIGKARAAIAKAMGINPAPTHLSICAAQDDTMAGFPVCDCGKGAAPAQQAQIDHAVITTGEAWVMPDGRVLNALDVRAHPPAQGAGLTDAVLLEVFRKVAPGCDGIKLTRDVGPYEVTEPTPIARGLAQAIAALAQAPTAKEQP